MRLYDEFYEKVKEFVSQVDYSHCGVYYSWSEGLNESVKGAFKDIAFRVFRPLPHNAMYVRSNIEARKQKFIDRGWKFYESK